MVRPDNAHPARCVLCVTLLTGLAFALFAGIVAQTASAQGPAICDEYPTLPQCMEPGGGGGNNENENENDNNGGGQAGGTGETSGNLPFTGYPVTPIILLAVMLLVSALGIRTYLAVRKRTAPDPRGGPPRGLS